MSNGRDKWEGRVEAQLEQIKESQQEIKRLFEEHCAWGQNIVRTYDDRYNTRCIELERRTDAIDSKVTKLEVKSGLLGSVSGFLGGLAAGLIGLFNR